MPAKAQQDKAAWQWVEDVQSPNDVTLKHVKAAYRCDLKPCAKGRCRSGYTSTRVCALTCVNKKLECK